MNMGREGLNMTTAGLAYGTVRIVDHDPAWTQAAADHTGRIHTALGSAVLSAEHVGSTAVAGLPAKPIIDLAVLLSPKANPSTVIDQLTAVGYLFRGDKGQAGGLLFVAETAAKVRNVHLHVLADGDPQWARYLTVRDRLRQQPQTAAAYADLKTKLAQQHPHDRAAYTAGKDEFLRNLIAELPQAATVPVVERVRSLLITPTGRLLLIRRTKPGQGVHWVIPGGGVEPQDQTLEDAAYRENWEEIGGQANLQRLIHVAVVHGRAHAIFLGRITSWNPDLRTGPELADPTNGGYDLDEVSLDPDLLSDGRFWPVPTMRMLADWVRNDRDPFTLPDLRETGQIRWRSQRPPQPWTGPIAMATSSNAKFAIAADHAAEHGVDLERVDVDLTEIQAVDVAAVAQHKAQQAFQLLGRPAIVEDSSFGLDELKGYPGALVKHFIEAAGARGIAHLADLTVNRACTFTAALVFADHDGLVTFSHQRSGTVAREPHGHDDKLPLWTVYIPPGAPRPLAALPQHDHDMWHRQWKQASVFAQFARWYARHRDREGGDQ